jgi:hypothetical protein
VALATEWRAGSGTTEKLRQRAKMRDGFAAEPDLSDGWTRAPLALRRGEYVLILGRHRSRLAMRASTKGSLDVCAGNSPGGIPRATFGRKLTTCARTAGKRLQTSAVHRTQTEVRLATREKYWHNGGLGSAQRNDRPAAPIDSCDAATATVQTGAPRLLFWAPSMRALPLQHAAGTGRTGA